jgi:hypothetical protein
MAARIARHHRKAFRKDVDNLAFALIAPLGAHDYRSPSLTQFLAPADRFVKLNTADGPSGCTAGPAHTLQYELRSKLKRGILADQVRTEDDTPWKAEGQRAGCVIF